MSFAPVAAALGPDPSAALDARIVAGDLFLDEDALDETQTIVKEDTTWD